MIYTTDEIENIKAQIRTIIKVRGQFQTDELTLASPAQRHGWIEPFRSSTRIDSFDHACEPQPPLNTKALPLRRQPTHVILLVLQSIFRLQYVC